MPDALTLSARSAFAAHLHCLGRQAAAGVIVRDRPDLQIASVVARKSCETFAAQVRSSYGLDVPSGPCRAASPELALVGIGPRTWLALREGVGSLVDDLQRDLGTEAAVSDQSGGYAVLRLSGDKVRATFEKGLGIDLHPRAFHPGDAAVTTCAHLTVVLWQLDEVPTYEVAVARSLAACFWHWLSESAAAYGLKIETGRA